MYTEIATAGGGLTIMCLIWKFVDAKVNKKQDKNLCEQIHNNLEQSIMKVEKKSDKIMETLQDIKEDVAVTKNELKHMNGKKT